MKRDQFKKEAKELNYTEAEINEVLDLHDEAAKNGLTVPMELDLVEKPIYCSQVQK